MTTFVLVSLTTPPFFLFCFCLCTQDDKSRSAGGAGAGSSSQWDFGYESADIINKFAKVEDAKEVFAQVRQLTGAATIEDFVERWQDAQDKNFSLYGRVAALTTEAEELRTEITALRLKAQGSYHKQAKENTVRKSVLEQVKDKLAATEVKMAKLKAQQSTEAEGLASIKRGLRALLETMDGEESEELAGASLMDYFGIVEQSVQEALVWYYRNVVKTGSRPLSPRSADSDERHSTAWDDEGMQKRKITPRMTTVRVARMMCLPACTDVYGPSRGCWVFRRRNAGGLLAKCSVLRPTKTSRCALRVAVSGACCGRPLTGIACYCAGGRIKRHCA